MSRPAFTTMRTWILREARRVAASDRFFGVGRIGPSIFDRPPPPRAPFLRRLRIALGIAWAAFRGAMS